MLSQWLSMFLSQGQTMPLGDCLHGFRRLVRFCQGNGYENLEYFLLHLESRPDEARAFRRVLSRILAETSALTLFVDTGIPADGGFLTAFLAVLSKKALPRPQRTHELGDLMATLFPDARSVAWLQGMPKPMAERVTALCRGHDGEDSPWGHMWLDVCDAIELLAWRVATAGLSADVRGALGHGQLGELPFYHMPRACQELASRLRAHGLAVDLALMEQALALARSCLDALNRVVAVQEETGVHVDTIHKVDHLRKTLHRLMATLRMLERQGAGDAGPRFVGMVGALAAYRLQDMSVSSLFRSTLTLLSQKIVESAGIFGEHYITATRKEYARLFLASAGGGAFTGLTTVLKFKIVAAKLPPLVEGMATSLNYGLSFLVMALLGWTLATKQSAMTAAALAKTLGTHEGDHSLGPFVDLVARISRSQFISVLGNILFVIPVALAFDMGLWAVAGRHFLEGDKAVAVYRSFHPFNSGTLPFAVLTGFFLWASSICGGWFANWCVARRIDEAFANTDVRQAWVRRSLAAWGRFLRNHASAIGSSLSLGFLLGMTHVLGDFSGLPVDVRHVTLGSGSAALAAAAHGTDFFRDGSFWWAAAGVALTGVMNVAVSFALSLALALRALNARTRDAWRLFGKVAWASIRTPARFFFPPKGP